MRKILILFLLVNSFQLLAQPGVAPQREVNGVMSYVHTVEAGNTLWGLQRMYNVKVEEIMKNNPRLNEGLQIGQEVIIPVPNYVKPAPVTSEYKVRKGETLYGLSRKFSVTVDELIELNPELSDGLKKGQIIKVPGKIEEPVTSDPIEEPVPNPFIADTISEGQETVTVSFSDSTVQHVVLENETMYSISRRFMVPIETIMKKNGLSSTRVKKGQVLILPVKQERIRKVPVKPVPGTYDPDGTDSLEFDVKDRYKVAVLLPFHLDYGPGYSKYVSGLATQYYMGATMAIDSLEDMGLNADIHFFDTKNDTNAVLELLNSESFSDVDAIIGPFFASTQHIVADYCKQNKIRMVSPVSSDSDLLENNRLVYASVPSNITMVEGMAEYVLRAHKHDKIILVKPTKENDIVLYEAFKKRFNEAPTLGASRPALIETTIDGMKTYLTTKDRNVLVYPVVTKSSAVKFMDRLNKSSFRARKDQITVFGTKEWIEFTDINNLYKNKFNLHFGSPNFIDYYEEKMVDMNRAFRKRYNTDMSKMAIQGYDVLMFYCANFFLDGATPNLLMNDFKMEQISESDGYENRNVFIVEQEEYELFDAENPSHD